MCAGRVASRWLLMHVSVIVIRILGLLCSAKVSPLQDIKSRCPLWSPLDDVLNLFRQTSTHWGFPMTVWTYTYTRRYKDLRSG